MDILRALYDFFKSVKLAIVLLILIAALSALSTAVPQARDESFYTGEYPAVAAQLILYFHFDTFFRSAVFLLLAGLFFVNLSVCTADRLARRSRTGMPRRHGPDIIHVGIIILMIGGLIGLLGRREGYIWLSQGEFAELPGGSRLFLSSFVHETYEDGRPRSFVSTVEVRRDGEKVAEREIRVNKPLKIEGLRIYQDSFTSTATAVLSDTHRDRRYSVSPGEGFRLEDRIFIFTAVEPGRPEADAGGAGRAGREAVAVFEEFEEGGVPVTTHRVAPKDAIEHFVLDEILTTEQTGLRVVRDVSFWPVAAAFAVIGIGLSLTFVQRLREEYA